MKISGDKVVSLTYDLTVEDNGKKELRERVTKEHPLIFVYGMGTMLSAFEKNIDGLQVGDIFSFVLAPEEAYGKYFKDRIAELPKSIFEIDGKFNEKRVIKGRTLPMIDSAGNHLKGVVLDIKSNFVVMDFNHPLAGEILHFEGEVIDVHEATAQEITTLCGGGGCNSETCNSSCGSGCRCN